MMNSWRIASRSSLVKRLRSPPICPPLPKRSGLPVKDTPVWPARLPFGHAPDGGAAALSGKIHRRFIGVCLHGGDSLAVVGLLADPTWRTRIRGEWRCRIYG